MKIQTISNHNPQVNHKGGIKSLNKVNPISRYADRYFNNMAKTSADRIEEISPALSGKIRNLRIKGISAWDINPSNSEEYILFLHGMSQNVSNYQHLYETIINKGKGVFAVEYRGYGENERAKISEDKLKKDVKTAYDYLIKTGIKPENVTVMGHSMGGALAVDFASKHKDIKSLVLICPLTKMSYIGKKFSGHKLLGLGIPGRVMAFTGVNEGAGSSNLPAGKNGVKCIKPLAWLYDFMFNSIRKIPKLETPTYYIQSRNDSVTTIEGARMFAKTARRQGVLEKFYSLASGGHKVDAQKVGIISDIIDKIYS